MIIIFPANEEKIICLFGENAKKDWIIKAKQYPRLIYNVYKQECFDGL